MKKGEGKIIAMCIALSALGGCGRENGMGLEDMQLSIAPGGEAGGQSSTLGDGNATGGSQGNGGVLAGTGQDNTSPGRAAMMEAYITILEDIFFDQKFPGNQDYGSQPAQEYDAAANQFAVYDVDGDGEEELVITYFTTYTAGQGELVYGFDSAAGTVSEELRAYPCLAYYDNGVVEEQLSHNHGMAPDGDFWPYNLYQYNEKTDCYGLIASVDAWSRAYREEDYDGNPFPEEVDADGDGMVYYIMEGGTYTLEHPMDGAEYQNWRDSYIGDAQQLTIPYVNLTPDNIYALGPVISGVPEKQIRDQSFQVTLDGWGEVTFASFSPGDLAEKDENGTAWYGDARFMLLEDGEAVYSFPGEAEGDAWAGRQFREVLSVAFKDYNGDGRTDILLLLEYAKVQEGNAGVPFRSVRLYTQEEGGREFRLDAPLMKYLSANKENMQEIYDALEAYAGNYSVCTSKTAWEVDRFARKVKKQILSGDFEGLSGLISYPVTVDGVQYLDKEAFLKADFIENPNPEFLEALEAEPCACMAASWQGVMMGNGAVWIGEVLDDSLASQGLKVIGMSGLDTQ